MKVNFEVDSGELSALIQAGVLAQLTNNRHVITDLFNMLSSNLSSIQNSLDRKASAIPQNVCATNTNEMKPNRR